MLHRPAPALLPVPSATVASRMLMPADRPMSPDARDPRADLHGSDRRPSPRSNTPRHGRSAPSLHEPAKRNAAASSDDRPGTSVLAIALLHGQSECRDGNAFGGSFDTLPTKKRPCWSAFASFFSRKGTRVGRPDGVQIRYAPACGRRCESQAGKAFGREAAAVMILREGLVARPSKEGENRAVHHGSGGSSCSDGLRREQRDRR